MYYPGLSNASANLCFFNAVLQALASITDLLRYMRTIKEETDGSSDSLPVINALVELLSSLNKPRRTSVILRPTDLIQVLITAQPPRSALFNSDQQDAHELLVMVIEAIENEVERLEASLPSETGLAGLINSQRPDSNQMLQRKLSRSPLKGLMATRVACSRCGHSGGIRHIPTDNLSFNLPLQATWALEKCLEEFTHLELLEEYTCRKCTLLYAQCSLTEQMQSQSLKKRQENELKRKLCQINSILKEDPDGHLDPSIECSLQPIWSRMTTKQTMFARPPAVLTFHVSRSTLFGSGQLIKNNCRLLFPEILILDRFTTSQNLCGRAEAPISRPPTKPGPSTLGFRHLYRLVSLIVHQGSHDSGHYLTFRRTPDGSWLRISDEEVGSCQMKEVLGANPTLLIYQKLGDEDRCDADPS